MSPNDKNKSDLSKDVLSDKLYGQHNRRGLGEFARRQAGRSYRLTSRARSDTCFHRFSHSCSKCWSKLRKTTVGKNLEDWLFLTLLGVSVAVFSFLIDIVINRCHMARMWMLHLSAFSVVLQFSLWVLFFIVFACFAVGITHLIAPTAIGSGIPEMKTMIRGVVMPEYLTFRTLVAKVAGLTASLGSGLPVGKEGPFVHIAGISAGLIEKFLASFREDSENHETRRMADILAPACAVGVACTFAAPVGGLLFSIEATAAYFAVRNYWRGFYAAACGTISFRLLGIWFHEEKTLTALERTYLPQDVPFHPIEMILFALLGVCSGFGGALFININKSTVMFLRGHKGVKEFLQRNRFIYPTIISFVVSACLFPPGLGQYMAGHVANPEVLKELFSNITWMNFKPETLEEAHMYHHWAGPLDNVLITTALFFVMRLWMSAISTTCPFPCGMIVPAFTLGAAFGRFFGESMALWFPLGVGGNLIIPGGYALVGSAAFAGGVTHTFSTVVIIFELTGQIGHILPCVIAVIIANVVSRSLTPSVYDAIIQIKKLPYLPPSINAHSLNAHQVLAEDIMLKNIYQLSMKSTYEEADKALTAYSFKVFPIVLDQESKILVGSIQRSELIQIINDHLSLESHLAYVAEKFRKERAAPSHTQIATVPEDSVVDFSDPTSEEQEPRRESVRSSGSTEKGEHGLRRKSGSLRFAVIPVLRKGSKPSAEDVGKPNTKRRKDVLFQRSPTIDLHDPDEQRDWESKRLNDVIDYSQCTFDDAPFQIVPRTSLYQVHSLFSLLNLHHVFVTNAGRLVGVITLTELRNAIQVEVVSLNSGIRSCFGHDTKNRVEETHKIKFAPDESEPLKSALKKNNKLEEQGDAPDKLEKDSRSGQSGDEKEDEEKEKE